ncbi:3-deoxy-D-manno-octulosonic acid kinase [Marinospirillum celere]|uniref:3-deoxy-D-manno-octulosonic acid kinase n=1 Tax=Marinospirillum celere TaxID=1122252 RepID=A0A1I1I7W9_9GAMM|nr:3-deoxy-D-manno-octulosonic acid kinase [Marinospirillum celere]SFC32151.1 3-deoxy-D-manno-octulosonic acid kinase [Marinospirillum celere]
MAPFRQLEDQGEFILYDPQAIPQIDKRWFQLEYWQNQQALLGGAPGRGTSVFIQTPAGEAVWRHYHRGGLPGRFIKDLYLWTGLRTTRAWQEMHLTQKLLALGLPVPRPLAARVQRLGGVYKADLITLRIPKALPLSDYLPQVDAAEQKQALQAAAITIHRFHQAGLNHTDLNPRNLLIQADNKKVWLIDFDRCQLNQPEPKTAQRNLERLYRGLIKVDAHQAGVWYDWLQRAYAQQ